MGLTWRDKFGRLPMPGYDAINDVINAIDPDKLAVALNTWLVANHDNLPQSLAIDGKDLGHKLGAIVTLCRHDDGRPVLMQSYSGKKDDCELPIAQDLLADNTGVILNAVITGDALHCQKNAASLIVENGGDYVIALKKNQKNLHLFAGTLLDARPLDLAGLLECGHGRIEQRNVRVAPMDSDISPFPHARQVLCCTRIYTSKNGGEDKTETRYFITSIDSGKRTHEQLATIIRNHWSVENLNRWKRDS